MHRMLQKQKTMLRQAVAHDSLHLHIATSQSRDLVSKHIPILPEDIWKSEVNLEVLVPDSITLCLERAADRHERDLQWIIGNGV